MSATLQFGQSRAFAALAAKKRSGKAAAIQKKDGLLPVFQAIVDRGAQFLRENGRGFFFPAFLPEIDDADQRHLAFIDALGQLAQDILAALRVVITLERGRGGAEQDDALFDLCPHDGDIARVIARRFLLLVGGLVFFIDHDQAEIFERREDGAARADHDPRAAGMNLVPFIVPLAFGQDGCAGPRPCPVVRRSGS